MRGILSRQLAFTLNNLEYPCMNEPQRKWKKDEDPVFDFQDLYDRIAIKVIGAVCIFGAIVVTAYLFPDAPSTKFAVAAVGGVIAGVLIYHLHERIRGNDAVIDLKFRAFRFFAIGLILALGLSIFLLIKQIEGKEASRLSAEQAQRDKEIFKQKMASPEVQKGMEVMKKMQQARDKAAGNSPATAPSP